MDQIPSTSSYAFMDSPDRVAMAARGVGAVRLTDVESARVGWLWPGRIPLGYVTLLVADPGAGKSLVSLDIAARVSTGAPWPEQESRSAASLEPDEETRVGEGETGSAENSVVASNRVSPSPILPLFPSSVLLLSIEDHFATTVRPRLETLGADCSRILGLSHVPGEGPFNMPRPVAINRDIDRLEMLLREIRDCRLIILDPITAFFGDTASRSTGNVWKVLSQLSWLAASANLAVLAISHFRKKEGATLHRAMGSLAFMAAARAAWTIATDPADPHRRLFLPLKNNLAETAGGLAFTIESSAPGSAPIIRWLPDAIDARADTFVAPNRPVGRPADELPFAVEWLRRELAPGPSPVRQIRQAAEAHGITWGTLRRAFRELGAQAVFKRQDGRIRWDWKLPVIEAQNCVGEYCAPMNITNESATLATPVHQPEA